MKLTGFKPTKLCKTRLLFLNLPRKQLIFKELKPTLAVRKNKWQIFLYILLGYLTRASCNMNSTMHSSSGLYLSFSLRGRQDCFFLLCDSGGLWKAGHVLSNWTLHMQFKTKGCMQWECATSKIETGKVSLKECFEWPHSDRAWFNWKVSKHKEN